MPQTYVLFWTYPFRTIKYLCLIASIKYGMLLRFYIFLNSRSDFYMVWCMSTEPKDI